MSRLTIEIDPDEHRLIKTLATISGMTIKEYILCKALPPKAEATDTTSQLMGDPQNADRLRAALKSPKKSHRAFSNIEELRDALGI